LTVAAGCLAVAVSAPVYAGDTFTGKVVGVADGDTIAVLHDKTPIKIRLQGVDAPEKAQPYGQKAKQFTSSLVFGKEVRVEVVSKDKYGRTLARVSYLGKLHHRSLEESLLQAGLAWWYRKYSKDKKLGQIEEEARKAKRGLWADKKPVPPWEWRREKRARGTATCKEDSDCILRLCCCSWRALAKGAPPPAMCARRCRCKFPPKPQGVRCETGKCKVIRKGQAAVPSATVGGVKASGKYHGNVKSKVLHAPGCRDYHCKNCTAGFKTVDEAKKAGYRIHRCVASFETCYTGCLKQNMARAVGWEAIEAECQRRCATNNQ